MSETAVVDEERVGARAHATHLLVRFVLAVAAVTLLASIVGLVLTHLFAHSWLIDADQRLAHRLADNRTALLDRLTGWGTLPADPVPVAVLWAGAMGTTYAILRRWGPVLYLLFAVGGEKTSYFFSTLLVRRPRPDVPTIGTRHVTSSFPSGHVGSAISLYGAIGTLLVIHAARRSGRARVLAMVVVAAIAAMVAFCRMYRGFHFATDIVAGACIGTAWLLIAPRIVRLDDHPANDGSCC